MSPGRRMPRLCIALLSRTLPPAGGAVSLLSCRHRLSLQQVVNQSSCPGGGSREDGGNRLEGQEAAEVPGSARDRLLRRAWGRSLSPLDRVSRMIPSELISKEVEDLQGPELSSPQGEEFSDQVTPPLSSRGSSFRAKLEDVGVSAQLLGKEVTEQVTPLQSTPSPLQRTLQSEPEDFGTMSPLEGKEALKETSQPQPTTSPLSPTSVTAAGEDGDFSPPQGVPFTPGDLLLAEYKRKQYSMFRKMFLLKEHGKLVSNWGVIRYQDILGKLPGQKFKSTTGHTHLLRRPSLEEYVNFMKRGPNICYPKDITVMMMMMDISPGDVVLEAGSGSGAVSLFFSRAVGSDGHVYSFDVRSDHHEVAKKNFSIWRKAWQIRSGRTWPENVHFINKNITEALPDIISVSFDAVVLDMLNPYVALPVITGSLKQGAVCVVYIANVTQVIDLLEGIRCSKLPLMCEKIIEVGITDWLVAPSVRNDGTIPKRMDPRTLEQADKAEADDEGEDDDDETDENDCSIRSKAFGQVPYIARPLPWQTGHTAFLVKLRKIKPTLPPDQGDSS